MNPEYPSTTRRVVLGDVDAAGVIYFGNVFRWHEEVFSNWLAEIGVPLESLFDSDRGLPVRSSWAEYPASSKLGETLTAQLSVSALHDTEFVFETSWTSDVSGLEVVRVATRHVACVKDGATGYFVRTRVWDDLASHLRELVSG